MSIVNEALKKAAREDTPGPVAKKHVSSFSAKARFIRTLSKSIPVLFLAFILAVIFTQRNFLLRWWPQFHLTPTVKTSTGVANPAGSQSSSPKADSFVPSATEKTVEQKTASGQDESERLLTLGVEFFKDRKFKEAEQEFMKVLSLQPANAVAHNNLGLALKAQERLTDAEAQYLAALQNNPQYPEALNNLGLLYEEQGRVQEAIQQYRKAIEISPAYPEAHLNYAQILERAGYSEEARRHYRAFLAADSAVSPSLRLRVQQHLDNLP